MIHWFICIAAACQLLPLFLFSMFIFVYFFTQTDPTRTQTDPTRTVQRSAFCRSRRELSNAYLLAKFGFDTAENEPFKVISLDSWVRANIGANGSAAGGYSCREQGRADSGASYASQDQGQERVQIRARESDIFFCQISEIWQNFTFFRASVKRNSHVGPCCVLGHFQLSKNNDACSAALSRPSIWGCLVFSDLLF